MEKSPALMKRHRLLALLMASILVAGLAAGGALVRRRPNVRPEGNSSAPAPPETVTIYPAKKILTMEAVQPRSHRRGRIR